MPGNTIESGDHLRSSAAHRTLGDKIVTAKERYVDEEFHCVSAERFGSGDGEGWTLLTRPIAFEPLPVSVLFALDGLWWIAVMEV